MAEGLLLTNEYVTLWAAESAYGTDAVEAILTDASADIVHQDIRSLTIEPEGAQVGTTRARGSHSGTKHSFIKGRCSISGEMPLTPYISAADQVPHNDAVLRAMNLQPDLGTASQATYTPTTVNNDSLTLYKYHRNAQTSNWRLYAVTGARLSGTFNFEVGSEPYISFEGGGTYTRLSDEAAYIASDGSIALLKDGTTATTARVGGSELVADQAPLACVAMTITIGGTSYSVQSLSLDLGWDVTQKEAVTGSEQTIRHVLVRGDDSRISGEFVLSDYTVAAHTQLLEDYEDDSEVSATITMDNGTDEVTVSMPKMQFGTMGMSDDGNTLNVTMPYFLNGDWSTLAADNDFSILYDAV